jgi:hypothetical protein
LITCAGKESRDSLRALPQGSGEGAPLRSAGGRVCVLFVCALCVCLYVRVERIIIIIIIVSSSIIIIITIIFTIIVSITIIILLGWQ